jgi:DNA-binding transcriptional regulator YiaG
MAEIKFKPDPKRPPELPDDLRARLEAMTDEEIKAAALSDPDNPPWTADDFARARPLAEGMADILACRSADEVDVRAVRKHLGLTQEEFAPLFGMSVSGYRKWEQGRRAVSGPARTLLRVMSREPEAVLRALARGDVR